MDPNSSNSPNSASPVFFNQSTFMATPNWGPWMSAAHPTSAAISAIGESPNNTNGGRIPPTFLGAGGPTIFTSGSPSIVARGLPASTSVPSPLGGESLMTEAKPTAPIALNTMTGIMSTAAAATLASKKKRGRPPKEDGVKRSKHKPVVKIKEDEDDAEKSNKLRWEDKWTVSLIHLRCEMQEEFSKPPKQGVNLWRNLLIKLVAQHPDFNKDQEACRKRWNLLFKEYTADKAWNAISGNDRRGGCWYEMIDEYMGTRANVVKAVHGGSISSSDDDEVPQETQESSPELVQFVKKEKLQDDCPRNRIKTEAKKTLLLNELRTGRKELLEAFGEWEAKKLQVAEDVKSLLGELVKKL